MEQTRHLYIMISRTNTSIGRIIRICTNYEYNHVSLSLDPQLQQWVSFARYVKDVPLVGGFVAESPERLFSNGDSLPVRIFRIPISEKRFLDLEALFALAGRRDTGLMYNTFGALVSALRIPFPVDGAYTCLEFANAILGEDHMHIADLDAAHQGQLIYSGDLAELIQVNDHLEECYFESHSLFRATTDTARHFAKLFCRTVRSRYGQISLLP